MRNIPAGTKFTCPGCEALICINKEVIESGSTLHIEMFNFEEGQQGVAHDPMKCKKCDSCYGRNQLHTDKGWI